MPEVQRDDSVVHCSMVILIKLSKSVLNALPTGPERQHCPLFETLSRTLPILILREVPFLAIGQ